jgi:hypothetical protein
MASTATSRLRLIKQGTYDNPETWGVELNAGMIDMVDDSFGGSEFTVSGNVSLTIENYTEDQARSLFLMMNGAGGFTVTVPAVDKLYLLINDCAANVTVTPLSGTGAVVRPGTAVWWYCDGTDGFVVDPTLDKIRAPAASVNLNGQKITSLGTPTASTDAATKGYIDGVAALGDLATVAAIAPEIVTVAGIEDGTVATEAVTDVAAIAAQVVLVAAVDDAVAQVADMFLGASASDPTLRLDGSALEAGDFYVNTTGTPALRFYSGSAWLVSGAITIASQAVAEAGVNNTDIMTPLRTAQAIDAQVPIVGMVPIGAPVVVSSPVSVLDFALPTGYLKFVVEFYDVLPSTDAESLALRFSSDGGSSFYTTGYGYKGAGTGSLGLAAHTAVGAADIRLTTSVGNATNEDGAHGRVNIDNPRVTSRPTATYEVGFADNGDELKWIAGAGDLDAGQVAVNAIRFLFTSGNIAAGSTFQLYGIKAGA